MQLERQERPGPARPAGGPTPGFRRWDLLITWAVVLLPFAAAVGVFVPRQRVADLEEQLVRDANALFTRSNVRPSHVEPPLPGAIGDTAADHLSALSGVERLLNDQPRLKDETRRVLSGEAPVNALPAQVAAAIEELRPQLDALLRATHAERADFPPSLDFHGGGGWTATWGVAATLAGARTRLAIARGNSERALGDGLDGLALGRDIALARGLVGHMVGADIVSRLMSPVAAALDEVAGPEPRRAAADGLRRIRDAMPPFSRTLRDERTLAQLSFGQAMSPAARAALVPGARSEIRSDLTWWQTRLVRDCWRASRSAEDDMVAAADLPPEERGEAFSSVESRLEGLINPLSYIALANYEKYALRADAALVRLDMLVLAAAAGAFRDEEGRWPRSIRELAAAGELKDEEADRLADVQIVLNSGGELRLDARPPPGVREESGEISLTLRTRGRNASAAGHRGASAAR